MADQVRCDQGHDAELVTGEVVHPDRPELANVPFWRCVPCGARVGCHPGTTDPLGTLADLDLRRARTKAHAAFDPIWKSGRMKRRDAYSWLATRLGIPWDACHIGGFDEATCRNVVAICRKLMPTQDDPSSMNPTLQPMRPEPPPGRQGEAGPTQRVPPLPKRRERS